MTLPAVVPTGELALAQHHLAQSVLNSATFQAIVGAVDPAGAEPYVWIRNVPKNNADPRAYDRPFALIAVGGASRRLEAIDALVPVGQLMLLMEFLAPADMRAEDKLGDAYYHVLNQCEAVIDEIADQRLNGGDRLAVTSTELVSLLHADETEVPTEGDYWAAMYQVGYDE